MAPEGICSIHTAGSYSYLTEGANQNSQQCLHVNCWRAHRQHVLPAGWWGSNWTMARVRGVGWSGGGRGGRGRGQLVAVGCLSANISAIRGRPCRGGGAWGQPSHVVLFPPPTSSPCVTSADKARLTRLESAAVYCLQGWLQVRCSTGGDSPQVIKTESVTVAWQPGLRCYQCLESNGWQSYTQEAASKVIPRLEPLHWPGGSQASESAGQVNPGMVDNMAQLHDPGNAPSPNTLCGKKNIWP